MILLLDDHPLVRQGLESILRMYDKECQIIQTGTVREAVLEIKRNKISKVFVDLNLVQENGFELVRWIRDRNLDMKVFLITASTSSEDFLYAKEMNVDAYILKDAFVDEILYGIRVVDNGDKFYSANLAERMQEFSAQERMFHELTGREKEVLQLLGKGYSNHRISQELCISEGTTKKHISHIFGKLGVGNRIEASLLVWGNMDMSQAE